MAQTLASGVVIPAPGDRISAAGVQEMRTLGVSVNAGLAVAQVNAAQSDFESRARDEALEGLIAGMEGMTYTGAWEPGRTYRINDVVTHGGDSWARLTAGASGEPGAAPEHWGLVARKGDGGGFGALSETDVPGLYDTVDVGIEARLAALELMSRSTGPRDITAEFPEVEMLGGQGGITLSRTGALVQIVLYGVRVPDAASSFHHLSYRLPVGFRPPSGVLLMVPLLQGNTTSIRFRVTSSGQMTVYDHDGATLLYGSVTFSTENAWPAPLPGTPS